MNYKPEALKAVKQTRDYSVKKAKSLLLQVRKTDKKGMLIGGVYGTVRALKKENFPSAGTIAWAALGGAIAGELIQQLLSMIFSDSFLEEAGVDDSDDLVF